MREETNICDLFVLHICRASIWKRESNTLIQNSLSNAEPDINQSALSFFCLPYHLTHVLSCFSGLRKLMMVVTVKCVPLQIPNTHQITYPTTTLFIYSIYLKISHKQTNIHILLHISYFMFWVLLFSSTFKYCFVSFRRKKFIYVFGVWVNRTEFSMSANKHNFSFCMNHSL